MHTPFTTIVLLLTTALLLAGCQEEAQNQPTVPETPYIPVLDAEGIAELRKQASDADKVLVIDCWATWCSSCVAMFPHLHEEIKKRGDGAILASLSFDEGGDEMLHQVAAFLDKQDAWNHAYRAAEGSDAKDAIVKALSGNWDGGALPAVFVYKPDGTTAYELLETRGEVQDWVDEITQAVDQALPYIEGPTYIDDIP